MPKHKAQKIIETLCGVSGFTLVELMVATLIMAGLIAAIMMSYSNMPISSAKGNVVLALEQDASLAMEDMTNTIRGATALNIGANSFTATFNGQNLQYHLGAVGGAFEGILLKDVDAATNQLQVGDFSMEQYGMEVSNLVFVSNPNPVNTVSINMTINLLQTIINQNTGARENVILDTLTFATQVSPRNVTL
ncbi:MAG: prepilin-type N-terminal cleavage/methylation domain-containing protein [Candidatus Schekmanbacteria bacterium]|nr:prepilin-type N-terminal cleavage/methylation domain-containing protein [Candidatus Schekmanbacteria bacterium]